MILHYVFSGLLPLLDFKVDTNPLLRDFVIWHCDNSTYINKFILCSHFNVPKSIYLYQINYLLIIEFGF